MVGLLPLAAVTTLGPATLGAPARLRGPPATGSSSNKPRGRAACRRSTWHSPEHEGWRLLSIVDAERLRRLLAPMLDPDEFLSDHGLRSLSSVPRAPTRSTSRVDGVTATLDYEPAESTSGLFGGNSNWRGPVWFPVNYLLVEALRVYHRFFGDGFTVECPTGSGRELTPGRGRRRARRPADRAVPRAAPTAAGRCSAATQLLPGPTRPGTT